MTSDLKKATLITLASICILPGTAILVTSEVIAASKQPQWPLRSNLTYLIKATLIALASMCILPGTAILEAYEAVVASI